MEMSGQLHALPTFHPKKETLCPFYKGAWWAPNFGLESNPHFSLVHFEWRLTL
jgi:hypothetical protein